MLARNFRGGPLVLLVPVFGQEVYLVGFAVAAPWAAPDTAGSIWDILVSYPATYLINNFFRISRAYYPLRETYYLRTQNENGVAPTWHNRALAIREAVSNNRPPRCELIDRIDALADFPDSKKFNGDPII